MEEKLQLIRQKCIEANPEIRENHNRCMDCGYGFAYCKCKPRKAEWYLYRTIRLADVLLAFSLKERFNAVAWGEIAYKWNLHKDDLIEQSDECILFLSELLK